LNTAILNRVRRVALLRRAGVERAEDILCHHAYELAALGLLQGIARRHQHVNEINLQRARDLFEFARLRVSAALD
jgi:hypothetical protein